MCDVVIFIDLWWWCGGSGGCGGGGFSSGGSSGGSSVFCGDFWGGGVCGCFIESWRKFVNKCVRFDICF